MGLLTAHGDPHMLPLLTVMLRSREQQKPQSQGTLIPPPPASLSSHSLLAAVSSQLAALIPARRDGPASCSRVWLRLPAASWELSWPRGAAAADAGETRRFRGSLAGSLLPSATGFHGAAGAPRARCLQRSPINQPTCTSGLSSGSKCGVALLSFSPLTLTLTHSHPLFSLSLSLRLLLLLLLLVLLLPQAAWFRLSPFSSAPPGTEQTRPFLLGKLLLLLPASDYCFFNRPSGSTTVGVCRGVYEVS